jgi:hypothetical protein
MANTTRDLNTISALGLHTDIDVHIEILSPNTFQYSLSDLNTKRRGELYSEYIFSNIMTSTNRTLCRTLFPIHWRLFLSATDSWRISLIIKQSLERMYQTTIEYFKNGLIKLEESEDT